MNAARGHRRPDQVGDSDIVAPALHEIRGEIHATRADIQRVEQKIDGIDQRLGYMKGEILAEIRRLDARIDGVDHELRTAIDIRERLAALEARRS